MEASPILLPEPERMSGEMPTVVEVSALPKVADQTVHTKAQQGEILAFHVRRPWRFRRTGIDAWVTSQVARDSRTPDAPRRHRGARK